MRKSLLRHTVISLVHSARTLRLLKDNRVSRDNYYLMDDVLLFSPRAVEIAGIFLRKMFCF